MAIVVDLRQYAPRIDEPMADYDTTPEEPTYPANPMDRAPTADDHSGYGFDEAQLWVTSDDKRIYDCTGATAPAVWTQRNTEPLLPGDVLASAIAVGTRKLVSAYAGACLKVKRASDNTTLDVGFVGEALDTAAYDTFLRGTTGIITQLFDQSGSGNHLTVASDAEAPVLTPFNHMGNARSVYFDYNHKQQTSGGQITKRMVIPAGFAAQLRNLACVTLLRPYHSVRTVPIMSVTPNGTVNHTWGFGWRRTTGYESLGVDSTNQLGSAVTRLLTPCKASVTPMVVGFTHSATTVDIYHNERYSTAVGNVEDLGTATYAGGHVGTVPGWNDTGGYLECGGFNLGAMLLYESALTPAQYALINEGLHAHYNVGPQRRGKLICDGDSITEAPNALYFQSWPVRMAAAMDLAPEVYNMGISGGGMGTQMNPYYLYWDHLYDANAPFNVAFISIGTNDLTAGKTGEQMVTDIQAYIDAVKAGGFQVIVDTVLPFDDITNSQEVARLYYNDQIRTNWQAMGCIGCPDKASDPIMGTMANTFNTALYHDGKHPTDAGLQYIAEWHAPRIDAILRSLMG